MFRGLFVYPTRDGQAPPVWLLVGLGAWGMAYLADLPLAAQLVAFVCGCLILFALQRLIERLLVADKERSRQHILRERRRRSTEVPEGFRRQRRALTPGQRCPFCHDDLDGADPLVECVSCRTACHAECAAEARGCVTLGCRQQGRIRA